MDMLRLDQLKTAESLISLKSGFKWQVLAPTSWKMPLDVYFKIYSLSLQYTQRKEKWI